MTDPQEMVEFITEEQAKDNLREIVLCTLSDMHKKIKQDQGDKQANEFILEYRKQRTLLKEDYGGILGVMLEKYKTYDKV